VEMPPSSDLSCRAIANYVEAQKVTKARSIRGSTGITVREDLPRPLFFGGLGKTMNRLLKTQGFQMLLEACGNSGSTL
jgi:hypothetical protein